MSQPMTFLLVYKAQLAKKLGSNPIKSHSNTLNLSIYTYIYIYIIYIYRYINVRLLVTQPILLQTSTIFSFRTMVDLPDNTVPADYTHVVVYTVSASWIPAGWIHICLPTNVMFTRVPGTRVLTCFDMFWPVAKFASLFLSWHRWT